MVYASQLRSGMAIRFDGQTYKVLVANYHPGQGKMGGVAQARLRNLVTGSILEQNFRADLKLEEVSIEKHSMEFLYSDGDQCYFMNPQTFEQVNLSSVLLGPQAQFLKAEMQLPVEFLEGQPVSVEFPATVDLRVEETTPPAHQQQDSTLKAARLENGIELRVPQFIKTGDLVRVDVDSLKYVERVKLTGAKF
jgi:elongation factor P